MATNIGLKIGVEGEAEFRKSINGINDSFKTLKSEMAMVTSAFDKNDQSQQKLTEANKVLNKQIDLQKQKLSEVSAVLEKSRDKYGENDAKTQSWQRTVNDATAELNKLERQLKDNNNVMDTHERKINDLDRSTNRVSDGFGKLQVGIAAGIGAIVSVGYAVGNIIDGMNAMEDQVAQTNAVIKSTGGISGMTADELIGLADAFEDTTKFAAEQTLEAENLLLTFTNIGEEVFPQATETLLDMATAMGTDAKSGAIQLGKALNDPSEGISALTRVGVTFTEEQKNLIKSLQDSGDMAGAQTVILQELQKEFGGSAKAAGQTLSGQLAILNNAFGEASEELLTGLMPTLQGFAGYVIENMPAIKEVLGDVGDNLTALGIGLSGADAPTQLSGWETGFFTLGETASDAGSTILEVIDGIKTNLESNAPAIDSAVSTLNESMKRLGETGGEESELGQMLGMIDEIVIGAEKIATLLNNLNVAAPIQGKILKTEIEMMNPLNIGDFYDNTNKLQGYKDELKIAQDNLWRDLQEDAYAAGEKVPIMTASGMESNKQYISTASTAAVESAKGPINKLPGEMQAAGTSGAMNLGAGIGLGTPWTLIDAQNLHNAVKGATDPLPQTLTNTGAMSSTGLGIGINLASPQVVGAAMGMYNIVTGGLSPLAKVIQGYGEDSGQGYIEGLNSKEGQITTGSNSLVQKVLATFRTALGIQSPSTEFREIAEYSMDGWLDGWDIDTMLAFANGIVEDIKNAFAGNKFSLQGAIEFIGSGAADFFKSIGIGGASFGGLTAPVSGGVTSNFGNRDSFMTDSGEMSSSYHEGIDIGAAYGAAVGAAGAGTVSMAGWNGGYGNSVMIDHGNGLQTLYAHLSEIMVSVGQLVSQLQTIGLVGSTGNSTGPHLHFGIYQDGVAIDPSSLFGFDVGSRYIPQDMVAMVHQGEMIVPKSENPYANSGGPVLPQSPSQKQPAVINLVLQNGSKLAEYLIDDINNMLGVKTGLAGRGMA